jgi:Glycosyltransferase family 87
VLSALRPLTRRLIWPLFVAVLASALWLGIRSKRETLVDFEVYRRAASRALEQAPLYRPEDGHYQYKYWPLFAVAMAPFAFPTRAVASFLWYALSVTLLYLFLRQSLRLLPERRVRAGWLVVLVVLCTGKFWVKELAFGQTNVLFAVVLTGALAAAERGRWRVAGVLIGTATFVKPYALLLFPWLAVVGGLESAAIAGGVVVAGLLAPALTYGWNANLTEVAGWYRTVTDTTAPNLLDAENISFATMWAKWLGPGALASKLALATDLAALALFGVVFALRRRAPQPLYLEFGLLMLLVPMLSPQGWDYVLLIAAPAFFLLFDRWPSVGVAWRAATVIAVFLVSFTIFDVVGRTAYVMSMKFSVVTLGSALLALCLTHLRWRSLA